MDTRILRTIVTATISVFCLGTMALCVGAVTVQGAAATTATLAAGTASPGDINWG